MPPPLFPLAAGPSYTRGGGWWRNCCIYKPLRQKFAPCPSAKTRCALDVYSWPCGGFSSIFIFTSDLQQEIPPCPTPTSTSPATHSCRANTATTQHPSPILDSGTYPGPCGQRRYAGRPHPPPRRINDASCPHNASPPPSLTMSPLHI